MEKPKFDGPNEIIGDWEYFHAPGGDLYRAQRRQPVDTRLPQLVAPRAGAAFALRLARISAGLPENGLIEE